MELLNYLSFIFLSLICSFQFPFICVEYVIHQLPLVCTLYIHINIYIYMNLHALYLIACCLPWMYTHTHENSSTVWMDRVSAVVVRQVEHVQSDCRCRHQTAEHTAAKTKSPFSCIDASSAWASFLPSFWRVSNDTLFLLLALWKQTGCPEVAVRARYTVMPSPVMPLSFIVACSIADNTSSLCPVSPPMTSCNVIYETSSSSVNFFFFFFTIIRRWLIRIVLFQEPKDSLCAVLSSRAVRVY